MLAEKFFLVLETLLSHASDVQPATMVSATPHVPIKFLVSPAPELAPELGDDARLSLPALALSPYRPACRAATMPLIWQKKRQSQALR